MINRIIAFILCIGLGAIGLTTYAFSPIVGLSFENDFAKPLLEENKSGEKLYTIEGINATNNLVDNMKAIFYPTPDAQNTVWKAIRNISVAVLLLFFVWNGVQFVLFAADSEEEVKSARMNMLYLIYGAGLIFLVMWVFGTALEITTIEGITGDAGGSAGVGGNSALDRFENNLLIVVLSFMKGGAFFAAIIFLMYYSYQMMYAFDQEEKIKAARTGMINVLLALLFMKIVDYLFFIAETEDFKTRAVELIVQVSKFLGYLGGIAFVVAVIYAGYLFITSNGKDDNITTGKNILRALFVIVLVMLLFMLIIFQVFNDLL